MLAAVQASATRIRVSKRGSNVVVAYTIQVPGMLGLDAVIIIMMLHAMQYNHS